MHRSRKLIALLCIGLVLFAAFTPGIVAHSVAIILDPVWAVFVPHTRAPVYPRFVRVDEQTRALLSTLFSRPPPALA
jgi:hypothetical protein